MVARGLEPQTTISAIYQLANRGKWRDAGHHHSKTADPGRAPLAGLREGIKNIGSGQSDRAEGHAEGAT